MTPPLRLSGTLEEPASPAADPTQTLLEALASYPRGETDIHAVLTAVRAASLLIERTDATAHEIVSVRYQGMPWLPAFATVEHLAAWKQRCGQGDRPCYTGEVTGQVLLEEVLPQLEPGTGVLLNPGSDLTLALPPVAGIVGPELAIDFEDLLRTRGEQ